MQPQMIAKLHHINQEFYQTFARSFASTRRRLQPGIRKILRDIPAHGNWLDVGCGSGALAVEWLRQQRTGLYQGVDFSQGLLGEAEKEIRTVHSPTELEIKFSHADLVSENWISPFKDKNWNGVICFAVLHHIPGTELRQRMCTSIGRLLGEQKMLHLSVWQVNNSPRLMQRILPWNEAGLNEDELDEGDVLMDWRAGTESEDHSRGIRYVHIFTENELADLAERSGFEVKDSFFSDGKEGNLGLYQSWEVKNN
jgi:SAM-dependent methyltransferase